MTEKDYKFNKPKGFDEWLYPIVADSVIRVLMERAVQKIHKEHEEIDSISERVGGS